MKEENMLFSFFFPSNHVLLNLCNCIKLDIRIFGDI